MTSEASSMPWVKLYTEMLDDPKLGRLDERCRWRFVQTILLAGQCDAEGYLVNGDSPMSQDDIAWRLRVDPLVLEQDMAALENIGVLENSDHGWRVVKFAERQGRKQSEKREMWRENKAKQRTAKGPEWDTVERPLGVLEDSGESPLPRVEKSREEKSIKNDAPEPPGAQAALKVSPEPLTEGQRLFLSALGAKQFKTNIQRETILILEKTYGLDKLVECANWASKRGMNVGAAVVSIEKAIKKWGATKPAPNSAAAELRALGYTDPQGNPV